MSWHLVIQKPIFWVMVGIVIIWISYKIYYLTKIVPMRNFLFNNGYTHQHHKTKEIEYPTVKIKADRVVLKNLITKSRVEVETDLGKWSKFLRKQTVSVEDQGHLTIIYLAR